MSLLTLQTDPYANWIMNNPEGSFMCRIDAKRAKWYLNLGIATLTSDKIIQINFTPRGPSQPADSYSSSHKENRCVVCGAQDHLTRHHVVPRTSRNFLPLEFKSRVSHDIVVICESCHEDYEKTMP